MIYACDSTWTERRGALYNMNEEIMKTFQGKNITLLLLAIIIIMSCLSGCEKLVATIEPKIEDNDIPNGTPYPIPSENTVPLSDEDALKSALAAHLGMSVSDLTIVISENTGTYARGEVDKTEFEEKRRDLSAA